MKVIGLVPMCYQRTNLRAGFFIMALMKIASLCISENACIISICMNDGTITFEDLHGQTVETLDEPNAELFIDNLSEFVSIYNKIREDE